MYKIYRKKSNETNEVELIDIATDINSAMDIKTLYGGTVIEEVHDFFTIVVWKSE